MKPLSWEQVNLFGSCVVPVKASMNEINVYLKCGLLTKWESVLHCYVDNLRTVPTIVIAHTFCASRDGRISYGWCLLIQGYFCEV